MAVGLVQLTFDIPPLYFSPWHSLHGSGDSTAILLCVFIQSEGCPLSGLNSTALLFSLPHPPSTNVIIREMSS
jgi:hypothetical protein